MKLHLCVIQRLIHWRFRAMRRICSVLLTIPCFNLFQPVSIHSVSGLRRIQTQARGEWKRRRTMETMIGLLQCRKVLYLWTAGRLPDCNDWSKIRSNFEKMTPPPGISSISCPMISVRLPRKMTVKGYLVWFWAFSEHDGMIVHLQDLEAFAKRRKASLDLLRWQVSWSFTDAYSSRWVTIPWQLVFWWLFERRSVCWGCCICQWRRCEAKKIYDINIYIYMCIIQ